MSKSTNRKMARFMMLNLTNKQRDLIQVEAFRAFYKTMADLPPDERFISAIVKSSDDNFEESLGKRPELIKQWLKKC